MAQSEKQYETPYAYFNNPEELIGPQNPNTVKTQAQEKLKSITNQLDELNKLSKDTGWPQYYLNTSKQPSKSFFNSNQKIALAISITLIIMIIIGMCVYLWAPRPTEHYNYPPMYTGPTFRQPMPEFSATKNTKPWISPSAILYR